MDEVQDIKDRLGVAEVVGGYIPLKQAGRNMKANCPFHGEKTASFMVSPEKGIWHCFGCGEGGDIFKFVMRMEGVEFREALEMLAKRAGVTLKPRVGDNDSKSRLFEATELAVKFYHDNLGKSPKAVDYLIKQRGLNQEVINRFRLGYSPEGWTGFCDEAAKRGFTRQELMAAGLVAAKAGRDNVYDLFRGRIMFPIADGSGRPIGFSARLLDGDGPKYFNTPQTAIYDKSRAIYGLDLAKSGIREHDEVILVEGNMDVVRSHQAGVTQVVATSGTALTMQQLKILGRLTTNVKFAFDQDAAGVKAAVRSIELARDAGVNLKVITIRGAKDPDELIGRDPAAWSRAIAEAEYVVDYLFGYGAAAFGGTTIEGKRKLTDFLAPILKRLADPVERSHYARRLAEVTGTSEQAVLEKIEAVELEVASPSAGAVDLERPAAVPEPAGNQKLAAVEEILIGITLAYPETRAALAKLKIELVDEPRRRAMVELLQAKPAVTSAEFDKALPNESEYAKILALRAETAYADLAIEKIIIEAEQLEARLTRLAQEKAKRQLSTAIKTAEAAGDTAKALELLKSYQHLIEGDVYAKKG